MIEYFRLNVEYLWIAFGESILKSHYRLRRSGGIDEKRI